MCLTLDALLVAFGVCFFQLQATVPFAPWLASVGLRYLNVAPPAAAGGAGAAAAALPLDLRIIQHRVLWLVKCCLYPLEAGAHVRACVRASFPVLSVGHAISQISPAGRSATRTKHAAQ